MPTLSVINTPVPAGEAARIYGEGFDIQGDTKTTVEILNDAGAVLYTGGTMISTPEGVIDGPLSVSRALAVGSYTVRVSQDLRKGGPKADTTTVASFRIVG